MAIPWRFHGAFMALRAHRTVSFLVKGAVGILVVDPSKLHTPPCPGFISSVDVPVRNRTPFPRRSDR